MSVYIQAMESWHKKVKKILETNHVRPTEAQEVLDIIKTICFYLAEEGACSAIRASQLKDAGKKVNMGQSIEDGFLYKVIRLTKDYMPAGWLDEMTCFDEYMDAMKREQEGENHR